MNRAAHLRSALYRRLAWLALCAMVFGAMAPTLSKSLATSSIPGNWIEICGSNGVERIFSPDTDASQSTPTVMADNHCGYCILHLHTPSLPCHDRQWGLTLVSSDRISVGSGGTTFFKRFFRNAHPTRAPPAHA